MSVKVTAQVWERSRQRGAHLLLLLALADHASDDGVSWPSVERLAWYARVTERHARRILRSLEAEGEIVTAPGAGRGNTSLYLVTAGLTRETIISIATQRLGLTQADATRAADHVARARQKGDASVPFSHRQKGDPDVPFSPKKGTPVSEKGDTGVPLNHQEPSIQEEEEGGNAAKNSIAARLRRLGIFPEPASEIASMMVEAGLGPDEAEEVTLAVLRATGGNVAQAVYRLRAGVWDAGEAAERTVAKARYRLPEPEPEPDQKPETPEARIWQAVLRDLELEMTQATFNALLRGSRALACEDGIFVVGVRSKYARDWLESRLASTVRRVLTRRVGREVEVRFVVEEETAT